MTLQRTSIALNDGVEHRLADASVDGSRTPVRAVVLAVAVLVILVMVVL